MPKRKKQLYELEIETIPLADMLAEALSTGGVSMRRSAVFDTELPVIVVLVAGPVCDTLAETLEQMRNAVSEGSRNADPV
jgi:hypothetical protein